MPFNNKGDTFIIPKRPPATWKDKPLKPVRERDIEKHLVDKVKAAGGEVRKVKWINRKNAPDRRVMHPRLGCWVELKAEGKKLNPGQAREITRMREQGELVYVFSSFQDIDMWLSMYICPTFKELS